MNVKFNVLSCTTATGNYILTIKQSTWHKVITETGAAVEQYSFGPWGRRRNPKDLTYNNVPAPFFVRGYTSHSLPRLCGEMLDAFGLINMNGRVYDPLMARFLSPDNYVQLPDNTQGFNRYSYCLNNPLKYTDPSGELIAESAILLLSLLEAGLIRGDMAYRGGGDFGEGFAMGYFSSALCSGFMPLSTPLLSTFGNFPSDVSRILSSVISNSMSDGIMSLITGNKFDWKGWAVNVGIDALIGIVEAGVNSGTEELPVSDDVAAELEKNPPDIDNNYNNSESATNNDKILSHRFLKIFRIKRGNFGINEITTKTDGKKYSVVAGDRKVYYRNDTKEYVAGYTHKVFLGNSSIHVSPYYTYIEDVAMVKAIAGHELIHALHYFYIQEVKLAFSETKAYEYSVDVLWEAGEYSASASFCTIAKSKGYWIPYPYTYEINQFVWYSHFK